VQLGNYIDGRKTDRRLEIQMRHESSMLSGAWLEMQLNVNGNPSHKQTSPTTLVGAHAGAKFNAYHETPLLYGIIAQQYRM